MKKFIFALILVTTSFSLSAQFGYFYSPYQMQSLQTQAQGQINMQNNLAAMAQYQQELMQSMNNVGYVGNGTYSAPVSSPSNSHTHTSTTSSDNCSHSSNTQDQYYEARCRMCGGSGKCGTCNGTRRISNPYTGGYSVCPNCTNGTCTHCGGSGKVLKRL